MSIDRTSPLKPVSTVQPRETNDTATQKTRLEKTATVNSTSVTLSDAQAKLMQPGSNDINMERVEALKTAVTAPRSRVWRRALCLRAERAQPGRRQYGGGKKPA
jgi:negative regulator of flagellin synthesis FlgM